jgi:uncharacterized damage-inducible protein DinB
MFRHALQRFREVRERTLALVEGLSQEELDARAAPDRWSAGEVLDHLVRAEAVFRKEIRELIGRRKAGRPAVLFRGLGELDLSVRPFPPGLLRLVQVPLTLASLLLPAAVRDFLIGSRLVPARHPSVTTPRRGRPAADLRAELAASLRETEALFEDNPGLDYHRMWYVHPLLGGNNVLDVLRIAAVHEGRHQGQIADVLRALGRPRPAATVR